MKTLIGVFVLAGRLAASDVSGPVLGLVETKANEYRVLRGAPGSLELGEAVSLPEGAVRAEAAPRQQWLLVERNGSLEAFDWQRGHGVPLSMKADRVAFSPSGREVALYNEETARLVVYTGLPERATVVRDERRGDLFEGVRALAVNDGGDQVVALTGAGRLLRLEGAAAIEIHRSDDVSSFTFAPESKMLVVGDRIQNAVLLVGAAGARVVLSAAQGLDDPDGVWAGPDGRLVVGSYKRGQVWMYDGAGWQVENVEGLARMQEAQLRGTLLLIAGDGMAQSLVSWGNAEQRMYALPGREQ